MDGGIQDIVLFFGRWFGVNSALACSLWNMLGWRDSGLLSFLHQWSLWHTQSEEGGIIALDEPRLIILSSTQTILV